MLGACDISADYEGSLEFTSRFTTIEEPFLLYDPITMEFREKIANMESDKDLLFHCVDHLPAEMPKEASNHFGSQLYQFVKDVTESDATAPWKEQALPEEIKNAVICVNGELTEDYQYIQQLREYNERNTAEHKTDGMQGFTYQVSGHLFDKMVFNKILDIAEHKGVHLRVVNWHIGNTMEEDTALTFQIISTSEPALEEAEDRIKALCKQQDVGIKTVKGPAVDKEIKQSTKTEDTKWKFILKKWN